MQQIEFFSPVFGAERKLVNPSTPNYSGTAITFPTAGEYYLKINGTRFIKALVLSPSEPISDMVVRVFHFCVANIVFGGDDDPDYYVDNAAFINNWLASDKPARLSCGPTHLLLLYLVRDRFDLPARKVTFPGTFYWQGIVSYDTHNILEVYLPDLDKWVVFDVNFGFFIRWLSAFEMANLMRNNPNNTGFYPWNVNFAAIDKEVPLSYQSITGLTGTPTPIGTPFNNNQLLNLPIAAVWHESFRFYNNGAAYWGGNIGWQMPTGTEFLPGDVLFASKQADPVLENAAVAWIQSEGLGVTIMTEDALKALLDEGARPAILAKGWLARIPGAALPIPGAPSGVSGSRCGPGTVVLGASGATSGQDYKWYAASSGGSALQTGGASYTTTSISLTAAYYVSIYDTTTAAESGRTAVNATVNASLASPVVTQTAGTNPSCAGASITLDAGAGYTSYAWSTGATTRTITASPAATTAYTVTGTTGSCTSTAGSFTLTVNPVLGAPVVTQTAGTNPSCAGASITLDAGAGYTSYAWSTGATTRTIMVSPAATTTYTVTGTTGSCTSTAGSFTLTVNPVLAAPAVTAPSTVGAGSPNLASVPFHAGSTYSWTIGNGTITSGQGTNQITFTGGTAGTPLTLSVTETNASGCVSAPGNATVAVAPAGSAAMFYTLPPCRVLDTRNQTGPLGGPSLQPGATRTFDPAASACGIPVGAVAISANLTVANVGANGELAVFPSDILPPSTSAITFRAGSTRANNALVSLSNSSTTLSVFNNSAANVDFILDVNGYFQ